MVCLFGTPQIHLASEFCKSLSKTQFSQALSSLRPSISALPLHAPMPENDCRYLHDFSFRETPTARYDLGSPAKPLVLVLCLIWHLSHPQNWTSVDGRLHDPSLYLSHSLFCVAFIISYSFEGKMVTFSPMPVLFSCKICENEMCVSMWEEEH